MRVAEDNALGSVDSFRAILAVVVLAAIVSVTLLAAPAFVGALISGLEFNAKQAGYTIAIEQACMSLAALPALWWMSRFDRGSVARLCLCGAIVTNLLCVGTHEFSRIAVLRGLTGIAEGSVMAVCLAVVGTSRQRERNFALWAIGQLVLGAVALLILPRLVPECRSPAFFIALALLMAAALPTVQWLPRNAVASANALAGKRTVTARATAALAAVLMFYLAISGVWTYLERIGLQNAVASEGVARDLSIASVFGIGGCWCAAGLGGRLGRAGPLVVGYGILLSAAWTLSKPVTAVGFAASAFAFLYAWTFSLPFLLAVVATRDPTGRLSPLINLMIGAGLGLGPTLYAATLKTAPDFRLAVPYAVAAGAISLGLALWSNGDQGNEKRG
jgi:MFS transporter, DHA1 family, inner membrane transport protein